MNLIQEKIIKERWTAYDYHRSYIIVPATPATGILYVTGDNPGFISGHVRMRGKSGGRYPHNYLEMIDNIFGEESNTIEVCSGFMLLDRRTALRVDLNTEKHPDIVDDGQDLPSVEDKRFNRWRCDPPYNAATAKEMYGTSLPDTGRLLRAGARVCKSGSLMFLLLGPSGNHQACPKGVRRIGLVFLSIVPNNEVRCLNIYYKYPTLRDWA